MTPLIYIIAFTIITIWLIIATEIEWFGWSTLTIIASIVAAKYFNIFDIFFQIKEHAFENCVYTIAYIAIGVIWSFAKWFFFLMNSRDKTRKWLEQELERKSHTMYINTNPPVIKIPQASDNKGRITAWTIYWPFSFVGTILNDPFRKLFSFIFNQFKNLYQKIANSIYEKDVENLKNKILQLNKNRISSDSEDDSEDD